MSYRFPGFGLLMSMLLLAPPFTAAGALETAGAEPHPETQLLTALDDLNAGRLDQARQSLEHLVQRQPNFRLAQLFYGEMLAARSASQPGTPGNTFSDQDLAELREEARLRINRWNDAVPENAVPDAILQLSSRYAHAVVVDLARARLYLLENRNGSLRRQGNYYASIGKNGIGKKAAGDNRTPVGVYTVTGFIEDAKLPELYGAGAFPVDYPNGWDRRQNRTGSGIWLHGVPRDTFNRAPRSSEGCVTLANEDLLALRPHFVLGRTPVVFSDSLRWLPPDEIAKQRDEFLKQIEDWRAQWSARDTEAYLAHYAADFETGGMNRRAFSEHKRRVNAGKAFIDVQLADLDLFRYPGDEPLMLARFTQHYRSDNYEKSTRKEQYWRQDADGRWRIVKEANEG